MARPLALIPLRRHGLAWSVVANVTTCQVLVSLCRIEVLGCKLEVPTYVLDVSAELGLVHGRRYQL